MNKSKLLITCIAVSLGFVITIAQNANYYNNLKWDTVNYKEYKKGVDYPKIDIDINYPQFIGDNQNILKLNKLIKDIMLSNVDDMKSAQARDLAFSDSEYVSNKFFIKTTHKVISNISGRISIELNQQSEFLDANGNPDTPIVINYDLNLGKEIDPEQILCKKNTADKIVSLIVKNLNNQKLFKDNLANSIKQGGNQEAWNQDLTEKLSADNYGSLKLFTFGYKNINFIFPPYEILPGIYGTQYASVSYKDLSNYICMSK